MYKSVFFYLFQVNFLENFSNPGKFGQSIAILNLKLMLFSTGLE